MFVCSVVVVSNDDCIYYNDVSCYIVGKTRLNAGEAAHTCSKYRAHLPEIRTDQVGTT